MRVLLDENLSHDLTDAGHEVLTVHRLGWAGLENGALLRNAAGHIDAFVTMEANLQFQQRLAQRPFGVVVIPARSNRMAVGCHSSDRCWRHCRTSGVARFGTCVPARHSLRLGRRGRERRTTPHSTYRGCEAILIASGSRDVTTRRVRGAHSGRAGGDHVQLSRAEGSIAGDVSLANAAGQE